MEPPLIFLIPEIVFLLLMYWPPIVNARHVHQQNGMVESFSSMACGHDQQNHHSGRVLGGDEAEFGEFPWITSIQLGEGTHFCAGFVVSSRFLISAAHCFSRKINKALESKDDSTIKVAVSRVNLSDSNKPSQIIGVKKVVLHPDFDDIGLNNDIAIVELQSDMEWSKGLSPICLPEVQNEDHGNGDVTVAGWGYRQCGSSKISNELHKITVPLWNADDCKKNYIDADYNFNRRDFVCAGSDGKDTSRGDSGGPLMFMNADKRWTAIGIVSSGKFMCSDRVPGVYTKVSSYLQWIKSQIE